MTWAPCFLAWCFLISLSSSALRTFKRSISIIRSSFFYSSICSFSSWMFSSTCLFLMVTTLEYNTIWFMCLTSSRSLSALYWALDLRLAFLAASSFCHSVGWTFSALLASMACILVFLNFDLARAAYFYSSASCFSTMIWSLVLTVVASLIRSNSAFEITTASFFWFLRAWPRMPRSSSRVITPA